VVTVLTFFLMGVVYSLAVPGRPWSYAKAGVAAVVALFCLSRLYQAVDHPDDALSGVVLGVAIPVTAFRFLPRTRCSALPSAAAGPRTST
jgi:hypothetical protein